LLQKNAASVTAMSAVVFHPDAYKGESGWLVDSFGNGGAILRMQRWSRE